MKTTLRIARAELCALFYSPVSWLILVIFAFQVGVAFSDTFGSQLRGQALNNGGLWNVTASVYTGWYGILPGILQNLYLYIPLLTMGLMSREYSSGSIKLLYSSPVTDREIILGKYFSMMVYNLLIVGILFLTGVLCMFTIVHMDVALFLTGLLGVYLLICAYAAIGLFMSSLTSYQVVAAMGTLAVLAVLNYIGNVGQEIALIRDITYWLSISGRAYQFIEGMICSEDVVYFLVVIVLFISLSVFKLQSERKKRSWIKNGLRYGGTIALALVVGYFSARPALKFYYDATTTKTNTLTTTSQDIVEKLEGGLTITTYVNLLDKDYLSGLPSQWNSDFERFEKYIRFKPDIKMKYVYYYDHADNSSLEERFPGTTDKEKAERLSKVLDLDFDMFLSPEEIREKIDLSGEGNRFVRILERENGQKSFLRLYDDDQKHPSEAEISTVLKRLVFTSPRVAFLTGQEERDIKKVGDRDYSRFAEDIYFRYSLVNQGFDVITLNLDEEDIPEDVDIVVIAEMKKAFTDRGQTRLGHYFDRGGNLFVLGDTRRQDIMNQITGKFGVTFMPGTLVQPSEEFLPDLIVGNFTPEAADRFKTYYRPYRYGYKIAMPGTVPMAFDTTSGFQACTVVQTLAEGCWNELETTDFLDGKVELNTAAGEAERAYPTVMALSRKVGDKEQRIVVSGDADCISNLELSKGRNGINASNFTLITGTFRWLSYDAYPLDTERPYPIDNEITLGKGARFWVKLVYAGMIPLLLAFMGLMIWLRRKGR